MDNTLFSYTMRPMHIFATLQKKKFTFSGDEAWFVHLKSNPASQKENKFSKNYNFQKMIFRKTRYVKGKRKFLFSAIFKIFIHINKKLLKI